VAVARRIETPVRHDIGVVGVDRSDVTLTLCVRLLGEILALVGEQIAKTRHRSRAGVAGVLDDANPFLGEPCGRRRELPLKDPYLAELARPVLEVLRVALRGHRQGAIRVRVGFELGEHQQVLEGEELEVLPRRSSDLAPRDGEVLLYPLLLGAGALGDRLRGEPESGELLVEATLFDCC
jgi:hypothetical protein